MSSPRTLRRTGALVILSTPVSGIISYAALATIIGEGRLETADGSTPLGVAALAMPLAIGAALIAWSFTERPAPSPRRVALVALGLGAALVVVGMVSLTTGGAGDPNIGGGVVMLGGIALCLVGGLRVFRSRASLTTDPG